MPSTAADFGPLIVETDIDAAVIATLRRWLPTYLAQARRERTDLPVLAARSYSNVLEDQEFLDGQLPAILVTTAQTTGDPDVDGNGLYYGAWRVVVTAVLGGPKPETARALAAMFGGCCRRLLVQHPSLDGFATDLRWTGGNVAPVAAGNAKRSLAAGINQFTVFVDGVLSSDGPLEPDQPSPYPPSDPGSPDTPYDPLAEVTSVTFDLHGEPIQDQPGS